MRSDNIKFKDIAWNTMGTVTYAAISLLLSVAIINMTGSIEGGIFSFGFSTLARFVFIISFFGIRPLHIVDIKYRFSFLDYKKFALKTATLAAIFGIAYVSARYLLGTYTNIKMVLLVILILHGAIDGYADCYESEYQRVNKLYLGGQSQFFRIVLFALTLITTLYFTNNLLVSEITALVVEVIAFYMLNIKRSAGIFKTAKLNASNDKKCSLYKEAFPLFIIVFLDMFIFSASKFSVDANLSDEFSGFFNLVFMPTNIIYLIMTLFMKPILTPLSNAYHSDKSLYNKILSKILILAFLISALTLAGAYLFGSIYIDIILFLTGNVYVDLIDISKNILMIVMLGGAFYTLTTPMYFSLIIENKQNHLLVVYIVDAVVSLFMSMYFVLKLGIYGAAICFSLSMFLLFVGIVILKALNNK